ncbi:EmrB/QacA subfamily drug resistance transporter [Pseudoduganella flava]|nr:MFS transporter [Pseudoduganella flava]TWI49938.1 EmrB/QacA subfamily drug resistance transporter [Pseudoduganella flava]
MHTAPHARRWLLAATILGSGMAFIDGTVVNVALPALQRAFGADVRAAQWVVESYALLLAALLLVGGAAGDRYGRRRVFLAGVALFGVASAACGASATIGQLIAARAVQGVGAALLVPGSLAIISAAYDGDERGKAIGTWSGWTAITAALGPVIGGYLVENLSWRYAFLINVPLALLVAWMTVRHVPESHDDAAPARLDWPGALLASAGLGLLVYGLIEAPQRGWADAAIAGALAGGTLLLAVFVVVEWRGAAPMLPLALFRSLDFTGANLLTLFLYGALGGGLFFLPLNLIQVQGWSATAAGAALVPFTVLMFTFSRYVGTLADRHGPRPLLVAGPAVAAAGFALLAWPGIGGAYWNTFLPGVLVLGSGMTLAVAPLTTTVMNAVPGHQSGIASGVNNAVSRAAALLAIAVLGIVMSRGFDAELARRLHAAPLPDEVRREVYAQKARLGAIVPPAGLDGAGRRHVEAAVHEAFVAGFRHVMWVSAGLALLSAGCAGLLIGRSRTQH